MLLAGAVLLCYSRWSCWVKDICLASRCDVRFFAHLISSAVIVSLTLKRCLGYYCKSITAFPCKNDGIQCRRFGSWHELACSELHFFSRQITRNWYRIPLAGPDYRHWIRAEEYIQYSILIQSLVVHILGSRWWENVLETCSAIATKVVGLRLTTHSTSLLAHWRWPSNIRWSMHCLPRCSEFSSSTASFANYMLFATFVGLLVRLIARGPCFRFWCIYVSVFFHHVSFMLTERNGGVFRDEEVRLCRKSTHFGSTKSCTLKTPQAFTFPIGITVGVPF